MKWKRFENIDKCKFEDIELFYENSNNDLYSLDKGEKKTLPCVEPREEKPITW